MREINEIIIHCAATPENKHFTVEDIDKWHKNRGFKSIGYHYVIYLNGAIHKGREEKEIGAHCVNHNKNSIGICYIGGVDSDGKTPKDTRTELQKESLLYLLKELKVKYPKAKICGHNDFAKKACPSFNVNEEYKDI
jgi:N-acetylmuramoyl-L-alanine amidase